MILNHATEHLIDHCMIIMPLPTKIDRMKLWKKLGDFLGIIIHEVELMNPHHFTGQGI